MPYLVNISESQAAALTDDTYWTLMEREKRLVDWAFELRSDLTALCGADAP